MNAVEPKLKLCRLNQRLLGVEKIHRFISTFYRLDFSNILVRSFSPVMTIMQFVRKIRKFIVDTFAAVNLLIKDECVRFQAKTLRSGYCHHSDYRDLHWILAATYIYL